MICITLLTLFAAPIAFFLFNELIGYLKVLNYRKQGIKVAKYIPLPVYIMTMKNRFLADDGLADRKNAMAELDHNEAFHVLNAGSRCEVYLNSNEASKEFYTKELEVTEKINYMPQVSFLGFFFKNRKEVQNQRAIFAKIFHYSNIVSMLPGIREDVRKHVRGLKRRVIEAGGELKVDLKKEFSLSLFDDLTGLILFKAADNKLAEKFEGEGMTVTQIVQRLFEFYIEGNIKLFNRLPFVAELGLNKEVNELRKLQNGLKSIVKK